MKKLIDAVKAHALEHYNDGGWDVIVECWEDADIEKHLILHGASTVDKAISSFKDVVSVWAERQADAVNSAF